MGPRFRRFVLSYKTRLAHQIALFQQYRRLALTIMPQVGPQGAQSVSNAYNHVVLEAMIFVSLPSPRSVRLELNAARHGLGIAKTPVPWQSRCVP